MAKRKLITLDADLETALGMVKRLEGTSETEQVRRALREWFTARGALKREKVVANPSKTVSRHRVLADHARVGKRFVPPMMKLGPHDEVSWGAELVPELIWLGLLNDSLGIKRGAELCLVIARAAAHATNTPSKRHWFAPISAFSLLGTAEQSKVVAALQEHDAIDSVRSALLPLFALYPDCPLGFIQDGAPALLRDDLRATIKGQLRSMSDRSNRPTMMVQANAVYIAFGTDMLKVRSDLALAKFPVMEQYPSTEESKIVGSAVRATVTGMFGHQDRVRSKAWTSYFWNKGFQMEGCEFR